MVRETLGDDAIIVATGEEARRKGVRVVAAIEPAFELDTAADRDGGWLQYDGEQDTDAVAEEITDMLLRHCVPEDVMDHIVSCVTVMGFEDVGIGLIETLGQLYKFNPLPVHASSKPIMMVGAPGSGKTLAVAKIAARGVMNGMSVGVISTDTVRAGGVEQLKAFTDLMNIKLHKAVNPQDLMHAVNDLMAEVDQVVIDTYGLNPFGTDDIRTLARLIGVVDADPVMVLPGGVDAVEAGEMGRVFATLGSTRLLATRVDIARRLGGMLAAAHQGSLAFADISNTPKVAQGLMQASPETLARFLLPSAYRKKGAAHPRGLNTGIDTVHATMRGNTGGRPHASSSKLHKTGQTQ